VLSWFINYLGPYPYKKLANVQSKTIFGGMENAGAIFYAESSVNGKQNQHSLIAHEIAHQWFGDMVTEKSFAHLWLSEGFATYLAVMFMEKKFGIDKAKDMLAEDRQQAIAFGRTSDRPVVDSVSSFMELLNANSYQKGGMVLHMLRRELGDSLFRKSLQAFYTTYAGKNADTRDLQRVIEKTSKKDLTVFFDQWLYTAGIPKLDVKWSYDAAGKKLIIKLSQLQKTAFRFPLELLIETSSSRTIEKIRVDRATQVFNIPVKGKPESIKLDPDINLLFEGNIRKGE
jgi:aminopeptidase N